MPRFRRAGRPKPYLRRPPYLRRALALLAGCGSGGCEAVMRMHGFTADQLAELVRAGFAATTTERMLGEWRQPLETLKITEAGDRALG
jgi:hypothetical protein